MSSAPKSGGCTWYPYPYWCSYGRGVCDAGEFANSTLAVVAFSPRGMLSPEGIHIHVFFFGFFFFFFFFSFLYILCIFSSRIGLIGKYSIRIGGEYVASYTAPYLSDCD